MLYNLLSPFICSSFVNKRGRACPHLFHNDCKKYVVQNSHCRTWKGVKKKYYEIMKIVQLLQAKITAYRGRPSRRYSSWVSKTWSCLWTLRGSRVHVKSRRFTRARLGTCRFQISLRLGVSKIKSKMARVEQQCATEGSTSSPYLQLSYFTIYLTQGIEILEYYTKVSC